MLKIIKYLGVGIVVFVGLGLIATFFWLRSSVPTLNGDVTVTSLASDVSIVRDEYGVPHIFSDTIEDAYTALGFVHAQDRLAQMEFMRWAAQGRLSEIVGAGGIETDKLSKTLNLKRIGQLSMEKADETTLRALQKYADGVNAYIISHQGAWPLEFILLGATPEEWSVSDIFSLSGLILFGLPDWQDEITYAEFSKQLTREQLSAFFTPYPDDAPVTYSNVDILNSADRDTQNKDDVRHARWPFAKGGFASNTWAVHGSRTESGLPLLASDPHGNFSAPIDYYLSRIEGPNFQFRGAGAPGFPAYLIGHNRQIAWGLTDLGADVSDLVVERLTGEDSYQAPNGVAPLVIRTETIKVKGGDEIIMTVRETRNGPIISDVLDSAAATAAGYGEGYVVSLSMEAFERGVTFVSTMLQANQATGWDQFLSALKEYDFQHNFSFADRNGDIGMVSAARLPKRNGDDKFALREGWDESGEWIEIIPVAERLNQKNPSAGFIANANNRLTPQSSAFEASSVSAPAYRIARITELLAQRSDHDIASMIDVQSDVRSGAAQGLIPYMTDIESSDEELAEILAMLRKWNGDMTPEKAEPLIYVAWLREFSKLAYADELGDLFEEWNEPREQFLYHILTDGTAWCDDVASTAVESCDALLHASLSLAIADLRALYGQNINTWRYGDAHKAVFKNSVFTTIPLISNLSDASVTVGGDDRTINNANVSYLDESLYQSNFGARYRQIIDMSDLDNSRFMIAPGVSGNIFSPYYKHLTEKWAQAEYITLSGNKEEVAERGGHVIRLQPRS